MGRYILHFSLCHGMWLEMTGHKYHHRWWGVGGLRYGPRHGSPEGGGVSERGFNDPARAQTFFLPPLQLLHMNTPLRLSLRQAPRLCHLALLRSQQVLGSWALHVAYSPRPPLLLPPFFLATCRGLRGA